MTGILTAMIKFYVCEVNKKGSHMKHGIQQSKANLALMLPRYTKATPGEYTGTTFHIHRTIVYFNSLLNWV